MGQPISETRRTHKAVKLHILALAQRMLIAKARKIVTMVCARRPANTCLPALIPNIRIVTAPACKDTVDIKTAFIAGALHLHAEGVIPVIRMPHS